MYKKVKKNMVQSPPPLWEEMSTRIIPIVSEEYDRLVEYRNILMRMLQDSDDEMTVYYKKKPYDRKHVDADYNSLTDLLYISYRSRNNTMVLPQVILWSKVRLTQQIDPQNIEYLITWVGESGMFIRDNVLYYKSELAKLLLDQKREFKFLRRQFTGENSEMKEIMIDDINHP